jgi:hypothetical protein
MGIPPPIHPPIGGKTRLINIKEWGNFTEVGIERARVLIADSAYITATVIMAS